MTVGMRPPAVAGAFYPADPAELAAMVDGFLAEVPDTGPAPKALIAPHAGYVYSGPIAASVYARLRASHATITRVVLLGPAHRVPVRGMAVSRAESFATPLGPVPVDTELRSLACRLPGVHLDDAAHAPEHSLEVHLPFLQRILDRFSLLPVVVGEASASSIADLLDVVWGGPETLVVVSSDLSHYLDLHTARRHDERTAAAIVRGQLDEIDGHDACGAYPVRGLLVAAARHGLDIDLIDLRTSGDTAGPRDQVVGYGAFALRPHNDAHRTPSPSPGNLTAAHRARLLEVAAAAVRGAVVDGVMAEPDITGEDAVLTADAATFVTLELRGALRGCIGSLEPRRPLILDVAHNAVAAALSDPRFPPVQPHELEGLSIKISVLTPAEPMAVDSLRALAEAIEPGRDGLVVEAPGHRATYLPSVWAQLPRVEDFVDQLWAKAGLRPGSWPRGLRVARYRTVEFGDS